MRYDAEELLLSLSDLRVQDIACRLLAPQANLEAVRALCPCLPKICLTARDDIKAEDVVLSELLSHRRPAGWLVATEACVDSTRKLIQLARDCCSAGTVLVLSSITNFDLVLVPRQACAQDGIAFAAFATRVEGVRWIGQTIAAKQVAVVLDLDSTLLEAEHLPVQPLDWLQLQWRTVSLTQQPSGVPVAGRIARLPDEPHHAETVHAASWIWKGAAHNYRVRQRQGWAQLRDLLIQENYPGGKLSAYVLSAGRPLYIQTAWQILDPAGRIIAPHEFPRKVNSVRPDGVYNVPEKTPCCGVGLRNVFQADMNMRIQPVWIADDIPEVFSEKYRDSVFQVEAYRPVAGYPQQYDADGSVLRGMATSVMSFWAHCYGADGNGGVVAQAMAATKQTLQQLCNVPMPRCAPANWCDSLFRTHETISTAMSVRSFLQQTTSSLDSLETASSLAATELLESEVAAAEENDENAPQSKQTEAVATKPAAVPEERALRPSSRQDAHPQHPWQAKPSVQLTAGAAPAPAAALADPAVVSAAVSGEVQQGGGTAVADGQPFATVSIVPTAGSDGDSRLVLVLGPQQPKDQAVLPAAEAAGHADGASVAYPVTLVAEAAHITTSDAEDAEVVLVAAEGSGESTDSPDCSQLGRKRTADSAGLPCPGPGGPAAPPSCFVDASVEQMP